MEKDWIKIASYSNAIEAELARQLLEENEIPAVVLNKQDSSYHFGKIELYVSSVNQEKALLLMEPNKEGKS